MLECALIYTKNKSAKECFLLKEIGVNEKCRGCKKFWLWTNQPKIHSSSATFLTLTGIMTKPINSSVFKPNAIIKSSVNKSISSPSPKAEIEKRSNEDSYYDEDFEEFDEFSAKSNEPELQNIKEVILRPGRFLS